MDCLLDMIAFDVGKYPHVTGILTERIARILSGFRAFEVFLTRIFLGHPDRIYVEVIVVRFGKPQDRLVTTG